MTGLDISKLKKIPRWRRRRKKGGNYQTAEQLEQQRRRRKVQFNENLLFKCIDSKKDGAEKFEFEKWKSLYYQEKLGITPGDGEESQKSVIMKSYMKGILWNFLYYYKGCASWNYFYPHYYAPIASDLAKEAQSREALHVFDIGKPVTPFEQLLSVLPAKSSHLLPKPYQHLMTSNNSPIIDLFSENVEIDSDGKSNYWEFILKVPFPSPDRISSAISTVDTSTLTVEEMERNRCDSSWIYCARDVADQDPPYIHSTLPSCPDFRACKSHRKQEFFQ